MSEIKYSVDGKLYTKEELKEAFTQYELTQLALQFRTAVVFPK